MSKQKSYITAILAAIWSAPFSWSEAEEPIEYNRDVRQILADNCFACHGVDSASRKADLRLDQRDIAVEFGAIVPGSIDESTLIERIETDDPELQMPPVETKKNLTSAQKELLKKWIAAAPSTKLIGR